MLDADSAVDGQLLAAGLAFRTLFALLPALLLVAGLVGWLAGSSARSAELLGAILRRIPAPLAGPVANTLTGIAQQHTAISAVGLITLAWAASSLYGTLDGAMARLIPGGRRRTLVERRLRGIVTVLVVAASALGLAVLGTAWSAAEAGFGSAAQRLLVHGVGPAVSALAMFLMTLSIYRWVPVDPPSRSAALLPALVVGAAMAVLTTIFGLIAPRLVGSLTAFGVVVSLLAAMIWLGYMARLLVLGAAWARCRRDAERGRRGQS